MLEVAHIARSYPAASGDETFCVFENLSLKVMKGEFVTVR
jgi:hypothetical protein